MKFLDLFAGIGGFRLGMESAGHECVGFCEIDKFARKSYKAIHNNQPRIADKVITVTNEINYDIQMQFKNQDLETSLDTNGDVFEPLFWLDVTAKPKESSEYHSSSAVKAEKRNLAELQKFFEFIENNKQNLFDLCGFKGELE
ncbi:DNA cytosine methyltransferase [Streptococcus anginosus]|uniref:DNA cytosine methyltransferase n=1 Tax=Streptococcus anginosus TaxID=1328 RepID=UPI0035642B14